MLVGTSPVNLDVSGHTAIQNLSAGDVYVSRNATPAATAGGRGIKIAAGETREVWSTGRLSIVAGAADSDVRVEQL